MTSTPRLDALVGSSRVVAFRPLLVDLTGSDVVAGLVLSQMLWSWHELPKINRDGRTWIVKASADWWDECRVSPRQVQRVLAHLTDIGLIDTRRWKRDGAPTTHISLNADALESAIAALTDPPSRNDETSNGIRAERAMQYAQSASSIESAQSAYSSSLLDTEDELQEEVRVDSTNREIVIVESVETTERVDDTLGFDEFWSVYPQRNGRKVGKQAALKLFVKLDLDDRRAAWRAARNYAAAAEQGTFVRDAQRFLKDDYWRDWLEAAQPGGVSTAPVDRLAVLHLLDEHPMFDTAAESAQTPVSVDAASHEQQALKRAHSPSEAIL